MKYFKSLKVKHKVTALGLAAVIAFVLSISFFSLAISTASAQDLALDKTYGVEGIETQAHLMNLLRIASALEKKATAGDAASQYKLGLYYYRGMMVGQDIGRAIKWLNLAHKQGHLEASGLLGELYDRYSNDEQGRTVAFRYLKVAADGGLAEGQLDLGVMYYLGRGVKQDYNKALSWYIKASRQGSARAEYYIGIVYELGRGVVVNRTKALSWYTMGANNGNKYAAYNAGIFYDQGRGVSVDKTKALKYFTIAAKLGSSKAQFKLGNMYYLGIGTDRSLEDSFMWLSLASMQGHKMATKAVSLVIKKMTVKQVRSVGPRIDKILQSKMKRVWF